MKVVIIGTGNAATVLGKKIQEAGHDILQVIGRNFEKTNLLASHLHTGSAYNIRYINLLADVYIIAVSDAAIASVASQVKLKNKIVVHTSASISKDVLAGCSENFGVVYPLQTLLKEMEATPSIPVLIDGNNEPTKKNLKEFTADWAETVRTADDEERLKLHVAAVFVSNFSNYLFTVAEQYCRKEQLKFNLLYPLIEETIKRLKTQSPSAVQTGPAVREDYVTIEKHNELLKDDPKLSNWYKILTNSIISFHDKNKTLSSNEDVSI